MALIPFSTFYVPSIRQYSRILLPATRRVHDAALWHGGSDVLETPEKERLIEVLFVASFVAQIVASVLAGEALIAACAFCG